MEINRIIVDLSAISHNVSVIRKIIGDKCLLMAVVKSDGYGHGAIEIAKTSVHGGADWIGVSDVQEGAALRAAGLTAPILVFGLVRPEEAEQVIENGLRPTITDMETIRSLDKAANRQGRRASVHLKVDTGMGRIGIKPEQVLAFLEGTKCYANIEMEGIYSHLSSADSENDEYTLMQIRLFNDLLYKLRLKGMGFRVKHLANSAATYHFPQSFFDLVRPGIMLYGLYPEAIGRNSIDLRPAMALRSRISYIKHVPAGTAIGYERTFVTSRGTKVATVPLGYGNGFSRLFSNKGKVSVRGQSVPIIGNICMNAFMVDVSEIDGIQLWDEVEIFGPEISVHEVARTMGTIVQEIVTTLGRIIPRCYIDNR